MHHISALNTAYALSTTQWQKPAPTNQSAKFTLGSPDAAGEDELSSAAGGNAPQSIVNALQAQVTQLQGADLPQSAQTQGPMQQQQSQPATANAAETDDMQADFAQTGKGAFVDVMA
jgi:hypothetical protein